MSVYIAALLELLEQMEAITAHAKNVLEGLDVRALEAAEEALRML